MKRACFIAAGLLCVATQAGAQVDLIRLEETEKTRLAHARKYVDEIPGPVAPEIREAIFAQRVIPGMCPYEAHLAAGRFVYSVTNDPKWPTDTNPLRVIWAQCVQPDSSVISLTFMTRTQFPDRKPTTFKVVFKNGKAESIERGRTAE